jgi:CheY-like chemotaxis protein
MNTAQILLVEDNEGDIVLTIHALEECKIISTINVVKNGQEALDFLFQRGKYTQVEKPDLILLDINIPIFSGHEVLKQVKEDDTLKSIPIIMLTTSSSQKDIDQAYEYHANSYVTKPLEMEGFLNAISQIGEFWLQLSKLPS